ncbi:ROK family protein [Candidatus Woesearchaeota archaeon]|nr:ROK family protein [Candidatus Woesearchaeota archaeon]
MLLGIDVGGTKIRISLISKNNKIIKSILINTKYNNSKKEFFNYLTKSIKLFDLKQVTSIGFGIPSLVEHGFSGLSPNIPAINNMDFKKEMKKRLNKKVHVTNDANCFAYGEYLLNPNLKDKTLVGLTIGTGLGSGIIFKGNLINGLLGCAGEVGFVNHKSKQIKNYGSSRFFKEKNLDPQDSAIKARKGVKKYVNLFKEFGREIGFVLSAYCDILAPDIIMIGGGISKSRDLFEKDMMESFRKQVHPILAKKTIIEFSSNEDSPVIGAANLHKLKYL